MRGSILVLGIAASLVAACGGGPTRPGGPTDPGVNSITVSLRDVVLVGTTAVATGTATLNNNQTQAVTTGWRSDAPAVASVTDGGTVTGRANGEATIIASSGGREGVKKIRVAPRYDGRWQGMQIVTACAATGALAGLCDGDGGSVGLPFPILLTARHPADLSVDGEFTVEGLLFPTFTAQIAGDGGIAFAGTLTEEGVRANVSWQINSAEDGRATGTIREVYSVPGISGELVYDSNLSAFSRSGALSAAPSSRTASRLMLIRKRITAPKG
jgi:hypothetical protein